MEDGAKLRLQETAELYHLVYQDVRNMVMFAMIVDLGMIRATSMMLELLGNYLSIFYNLIYKICGNPVHNKSYLTGHLTSTTIRYYWVAYQIPIQH